MTEIIDSRVVETQVVDIEVERRKMEAEFQGRFEVWKAKDLAQLKIDQQEEIQDAIKKLYTKWESEQKPPTEEDLRKLLSQEYAEITVKLHLYQSNQVEEFTIRELPQSIERKFYKQFAQRIKDKGPELSAFVQKNMDQSFEKTLEGFLNTFDGAFDIMTDAMLLVLNPFGKREDITREWVANNISSNRMYSIILGQIEVNRLRDFFLRLFQSGTKAGTMMNPLNFQQLQALAR